MIVNIYGSTGEIGKKTLNIISKNFPYLKINLLCANSNVKLIFKQINKFKPKYVYLNNENSSKKLQSKLNKNTKLLNYDELKKYLKETKSDYSILAISGYKSLYYIEDIIKNTTNLGIANKEVFVSAGHIFKKKKYFKKTNIFPLDSEHFSIHEYLDNLISKNTIKEFIITASGGPFYKTNFKDLKNITFNEAIKHPKWKMGYKNSIDSATLVNKCLEVIEAHYLFNIPFNNIKVLIHPQALVHSVIIKKNYVTTMNMFKNDMSIPIINFFTHSGISSKKSDKKLFVYDLSELQFLDVNYNKFPIYKYFLKLNKYDPSNLIKLNVGNEFAVNLFKKGRIRYTDIYKIIKKVISLNLYYPLNTIKDVINYHEDLENKIKDIFKNII